MTDTVPHPASVVEPPATVDDAPRRGTRRQPWWPAARERLPLLPSGPSLRAAGRGADRAPRPLVAPQRAVAAWVAITGLYVFTGSGAAGYGAFSLPAAVGTALRVATLLLGSAIALGVFVSRGWHRRRVLVFAPVAGLAWTASTALFRGGSTTAMIILLLTATGFVVPCVYPRASMNASLWVTRAYVVGTSLLLVGPPRPNFYSATASRASVYSVVGSDRLQAFTASPNYFAGLMSVYVVLEVALLSRPSARGSRWWRLVLVALSVVLLLQTGSQTSLLGAGMGVAALAVAAVAPVRRVLTLSATALIAVPATVVALTVTHGLARFPFADDFATGRGFVWRLASEYLSESPLRGIPIDAVLPTATTSNSFISDGSGHAHDLLLQFWLMGGAIAAVCMLLAMVALGGRATRSRVGTAVFCCLAMQAFTELPFVVLPGSLNAVLMLMVLGTVCTEAEVVRRRATRTGANRHSASRSW